MRHDGGVGSINRIIDEIDLDAIIGSRDPYERILASGNGGVRPEDGQPAEPGSTDEAQRQLSQLCDDGVSRWPGVLSDNDAP
jgi:hypothetical protein